MFVFIYSYDFKNIQCRIIHISRKLFKNNPIKLVIDELHFSENVWFERIFYYLYILFCEFIKYYVIFSKF